MRCFHFVRRVTKLWAPVEAPRLFRVTNQQRSACQLPLKKVGLLLGPPFQKVAYLNVLQVFSIYAKREVVYLKFTFYIT